MLRLFLPPNLPAAAERGAIAVKLEIDSAQEPSPEMLPALALLQRWCGTATPPKFIQLSRAQFDELARSLAGHPVFFWLNDPTRPIPWEGKYLAGVPELPDPVVAPPEQGGKAGSSHQATGAPIRPRQAAVAGTPALIDGSEHYLSVQIPSREHASYGPLMELLKRSGFLLEPSNRRWWLRDRHKALNFLAEHGTRLREEWQAGFTENYRRNTARLQEADTVCSAEEAGDGFSLTIALRAGQAGAEKIRSALASNCGYVEDQGRIYLLDARRTARLAAAQKALSGDPGAPLVATRSVKVSALQVAEAQAVIEGISPDFQPPAAWRARTEALRNLSSLEPARLPAEFNGVLRPYQRLGA
ncbi:MAG: ATP-dependent helicase, partial [Opitutaceae bacterium]